MPNTHGSRPTRRKYRLPVVGFWRLSMRSSVVSGFVLIVGLSIRWGRSGPLPVGAPSAASRNVPRRHPAHLRPLSVTRRLGISTSPASSAVSPYPTLMNAATVEEEGEWSPCITHLWDHAAGVDHDDSHLRRTEPHLLCLALDEWASRILPSHSAMTRTTRREPSQIVCGIRSCRLKTLPDPPSNGRLTHERNHRLHRRRRDRCGDDRRSRQR